MKIILTRGCICGSLEIDGEELTNMTLKQKKEALMKILDSLDSEDLDLVFSELTMCFGDYDCDKEPCECCGDYVETYTWEI